jgi:formylglycine-generating enzyme required for sulfatase activity
LGDYLIDRFEVTSSMFANFLNSVRARAECRDGATWAVDGNGQSLCADAVEFVIRRGIAGSDHAVGVTYGGGDWSATDGAERCPVTLVTWFGALAYARFVGCGLPTEMEWEKAARGPDGRRFPWGDEYDPARANTADRWLGRKIPDQRSWDEDFHQNGHGPAWLASRPLPVGTMSGGGSFFGCEDMIGNVAEWCIDAWFESPWRDLGGAKLPATSTLRSMRGAGRYGYAAISRCACRRRRDPHTASENLGFRCARALRS